MRRHFPYLICIGLLLFSYTTAVVEVDRLNKHIEYLEGYIQENELPTPAFQIDTDRFHFRLESNE